MSVRVINLGLPKSGTTSLGVALEKAGMTVADFKIRRGKSPDPAIAGSFVARQMYEGYFQTGDPLDRLQGFDALSEVSVLSPRLCLWPQTDFGLLQALRSHHPDLRFVASRRDARDMSGSMLRWSDLGSDRLPRGNIPGLPSGYGDTTLERVQWIEAHYAFLRHVFAGDDRFLEYDTEAEDTPERLSVHLGIDLPWWGRANVNTALPARGVA